MKMQDEIAKNKVFCKKMKELMQEA